jgi:hypothetical protein
MIIENTLKKYFYEQYKQMGIRHNPQRNTIQN